MKLCLIEIRPPRPNSWSLSYPQVAVSPLRRWHWCDVGIGATLALVRRWHWCDVGIGATLALVRRWSFNQLFANLAFASEGRPLKIIAFTSPLPGEGKTLSAINFALAGVARGLRVLLVDADLRCGVVSTALGIDRAPGFAEMLAGTASPVEAVRRVARDETGSLLVMPSGALPKEPARVLTVDRIRDVLALMIPKVDLVVIDTPPVNLLADAGMLGAAADAVLLVVRAGHTQADDLRYAMEQLEAMRAPVIGTLLNDIDVRRNARDDGSYRYLAEAGRYHVSAS